MTTHQADQKQKELYMNDEQPAMVWSKSLALLATGLRWFTQRTPAPIPMPNL
jgi:hypothetical protein